MTANAFRRIALAMEGAVESAHMGHPDFRVKGRIFATLHADNNAAMVKLSPEQQQDFVREHRSCFLPENGAWGRLGCTRVLLGSADEETVGEAMTLAWQGAVNPTTKSRTKSRAPRGRKVAR